MSLRSLTESKISELSDVIAITSSFAFNASTDCFISPEEESVPPNFSRTVSSVESTVFFMELTTSRMFDEEELLFFPSSSILSASPLFNSLINSISSSLLNSKRSEFLNSSNSVDCLWFTISLICSSAWAKEAFT